MDTPARLNDLQRTTLAIVLAGGRGTRLGPLTNKRVKPAVHFGGKFRIIDFALSNCLNSGIRRIAVVTQYKAHSLLRHLQRGWGFLRGEFDEFVDLLPAQQRVEGAHWYRGTADAVFQNLDIIRSIRPKYVVVLAGDHIYKMDYTRMIADHADSGADCTVGCIEVPRMEAVAFGVMARRRKPPRDRLRRKARRPARRCPAARIRRSPAWASTSSAPTTCTRCSKRTSPASTPITTSARTSSRAWSRKARRSRIRSACRACRRSPDVEPYWRDVGTIDAYWAANLDLASTIPTLDLYDRNWPIWTYQEQLPPAKFVRDLKGLQGSGNNLIVCGGCVISGSQISRSVLSSNVKVSSFCNINEAVLLPQVTVGASCRLQKVVIDRGCAIPDGTVIGEDPAADAERFYRTDDGVVLVTPRSDAAEAT